MTGILLGVAALLVALGFLLLFRSADRRALGSRRSVPWSAQHPGRRDGAEPERR